MDTPETKVKKRFDVWLRLQARSAPMAWWAYSDRYRAGEPDRLVLWDGFALGFEVKAPGEQMRPRQIVTRANWHRAGSPYCCVTLTPKGQLVWQIQLGPIWLPLTTMAVLVRDLKAANLGLLTHYVARSSTAA